MPALTRDLCAQHLYEQVFTLSQKPEPGAPCQLGKVGLEIEMLPFIKKKYEGGARPEAEPVPIGRLSSPLFHLAKELGWAVERDESARDLTLAKIYIHKAETLTFEPGAQLEYSSLPHPSLPEVRTRLRSIQSSLTTALGADGISLMQVGCNPWHTVERIGLQMAKPRYRAMDQYFSKISPYGQRMMRQTCSIQVCLDFGHDEGTMAKRYALGLLLAPFATAIFANSPYADGRAVGCKSFRSKIWRHLDQTRTGVHALLPWLHTLEKHQLVESYLDFALSAHVVFMEGLDYAVPEKPLPFATWMKEGYHGHKPTLEDFITHLSLLFPEVRPRGFMEIRSVDCQAPVFQEVAAVFFIGLLYDASCLDRSLALLSSYADQIPSLLHASSQGLDDPILAHVGRQLMEMSLEGYARLPGCYQEKTVERAFKNFYHRFTEKSQTPAHGILHFRKDSKAGDLGAPTYEDYQKMEEAWTQI